MKYLLGILLIVFLVVVGPFCTIWALLVLKDVLINNTSPYTIDTWMAVVVLWGLGFGIRNKTSK